MPGREITPDPSGLAAAERFVDAYIEVHGVADFDTASRSECHRRAATAAEAFLRMSESRDVQEEDFLAAYCEVRGISSDLTCAEDTECILRAERARTLFDRVHQTGGDVVYDDVLNLERNCMIANVKEEEDHATAELAALAAELEFTNAEHNRVAAELAASQAEYKRMEQVVEEIRADISKLVSDLAQRNGEQNDIAAAEIVGSRDGNVKVTVSPEVHVRVEESQTMMEVMVKEDKRSDD